MQLNVSTCYAMQIMLHLTRNKRIVSSAELALSLNISQRYTLGIAKILRNAGLISTTLGIHGGVAICKEPTAISTYDVIRIMEGCMSIPDCLTPDKQCGEPCKSTNIYESFAAMKDYIDAYLKRITLDELAEMDTDGHLADIIAMVGGHIEDMKQ